MGRSIVLKAVTLIFVLLNVGGLSAQTTTNANGWFMYFGEIRVRKIGIHHELQVRRNEIILNPQQLLIRTGINYHFSKATSATVGFAFVETYPYGDFPVNKAFPERRLWEQFQHAHRLGRFNLNHRMRLEQRFVGNSATGSFEGGFYVNRFRYMLRSTVEFTVKKKDYYIATYDEIFIPFGAKAHSNNFDQNRLYAALGFHVPIISSKIEIGYMNQYLQHRTGNKWENNHTFQLAWFCKIE